MRWTRTVRYTRVRIAAAVPPVGIGLALGGIDPDACNMRWNGVGALRLSNAHVVRIVAQTAQLPVGLRCTEEAIPTTQSICWEKVPFGIRA